MRVGINGFGVIGRALLRRLEAVPDLEVVAVNEAVLGAAEAEARYRAEGPSTTDPELVGRFSDRALMLGDRRITWSSLPYPDGRLWADQGVVVVVEAARLFDRAELEAQSDGGKITVVMTGDLRQGLPDLTLVLGVNDAEYRPDHVILCAGSDRTQSLCPVLRVLHDRFGLEQVHCCHIRPPYPGHDWELVARRDLGEHLERAQPELCGIYHGFRLAAPGATRATAWIDATTCNPTSTAALRAALEDAGSGRFQGVIALAETASTLAGQTVSALVATSSLLVEGNRVWLKLECDPVVSYTERIVEILQWLRA